MNSSHANISYAVFCLHEQSYLTSMHHPGSFIHHAHVPASCKMLLLIFFFFFFFLNDAAPTEIYPLPLHDALPICHESWVPPPRRPATAAGRSPAPAPPRARH